MKIYVGGVNAVGKSTLLKKVCEGADYEYIHATTGLLQHLGFGNDYERLRALTQEERDVKYGEYIQSLLKDEKHHDFLLDAHYLGLVRGKIDQVTRSWLRDFDTFVLISSPIDDIWERIIKDSKVRDRALFPSEMSESDRKKMLAVYQKQTVEEFRRLSDLYKKPNFEIVNRKGLLEQALAEFSDFLGNPIRRS
jgi:adenylate kinase family enzyme